jgi:diguanylate cyclase (GGDEF)-like protein
MTAGTARRRLVASLPRGGALPDHVFWRRHQAILWVLWAHIAGLAVFGLARGFSPGRVAVVLFPVVIFTMVASWPAFRGRTLRPAMAALGLLSSSAALVYLWSGVIEGHFHFFVTLAIVALYQSWSPYLIAVAFVLLHHGLLGSIAAHTVFNHAAANRDPWAWAAIHALFVAAVSVATLAAWRQSEDARAEAEHQAETRAEQEALRRLAEAVAEDLDHDRLFELAASEAAALLGVETGAVARFEGEHAAIVGAVGRPISGVGARISLRSGSSLAVVHRSGRPARVDYATLEPNDPVRLLAEEHGHVQAVAAPIMVGSRAWGGLAVGTTRENGLPAGAEDRLARFARLVAVSVVNADARHELEARASTDPLTGLANHRAFHERLGIEVERARRHDRALALVVLDLDHFKRVNDTHGHPVGDAILADLGRRLLGQIRPGDMLARIGGEEFALLLPETDALGGWEVAERAREAVGADPFPTVGRLTLSAGVCDLERAGSAGELVALADRALYRAKGRGRDVSVVTSEAPRTLPR